MIDSVLWKKPYEMELGARGRVIKPLVAACWCTVSRSLNIICFGLHLESVFSFSFRFPVHVGVHLSASLVLSGFCSTAIRHYRCLANAPGMMTFFGIVFLLCRNSLCG